MLGFDAAMSWRVIESAVKMMMLWLVKINVDRMFDGYMFLKEIQEEACESIDPGGTF